ncbi:FeS assembly ATPase SufC, partial [mine drainage metagenome]
KTTLASTIMGKNPYVVTSGGIFLNDLELTNLPTYQRARAGLFMIAQYPPELVGVSFDDLARELNLDEARLAAKDLSKEAVAIGLSPELLSRSVNVGFSGGEKKRAETFQLATFGAKIAILDELDSGLDIDALRDVSRRIALMVKEEGLGVLVITHYSRLLRELEPDFVHVFEDGHINRSGGPELAFELERTGYGPKKR